MNFIEQSNKAYESLVMMHSYIITQPPLPNIQFGHNYAMGITGALLTGTVLGVIGHAVGGFLSFVQEHQIKGPISWRGDGGGDSLVARQASENINRNESYRTGGAIIGFVSGALVGGYIGLSLK